MSFGVLIQVLFDILAVAGLAAVWLKLSRPAKDDPRMSRGLQLLQTKISVLEDLSDRTETQVTQLTALMEHKVKEIQQQILNADKTIQKVDSSISKSLEVAKIFQDRIPHQEIVERQNTIKYVKAARMAHQGSSVQDISYQVDLPIGEIEFISKVNKNQLQFSEEALPEWARSEGDSTQEPTPKTFFTDENLATAPTPPLPTPSIPQTTPAQVSQQPLAKTDDRMTLSDLGDRFRQAIQGQAPAPVAPPTFIVEGQNAKGEKIQVRKVVFPKVDAGSGRP